jgi:hypothetical protein
VIRAYGLFSAFYFDRGSHGAHLTRHLRLPRRWPVRRYPYRRRRGTPIGFKKELLILYS